MQYGIIESIEYLAGWYSWDLISVDV